MDTARRLYLHLIAGISLAMWASGLTHIVATSLATVTEDRSVDLASDRMSEALAMVVVGGLIWLVHWVWGLRSCAGEGEGARSERASLVRGGYFGIVILSTLAATMTAAYPIVRWACASLLGADAEVRHAPSIAATFLVYGVLWATHVRRRLVEVSRTALVGASATLSQVDRHVAAWAGLTLTVAGISAVLVSLLELVVGFRDIADGTWSSVLASAAAVVVIGGACWALNWRLAQHDTDATGAPSVVSPVRAAYVAMVVVQGVVVGLAALGAAVLAVGRLALGVSDAMDPVRVAEEAAWYIAAASPFVVVAWLQQRHTERALRGLGGSFETRSHLVAARVAASVGLAFAVTGLVVTLATLFEAVGGPLSPAPGSEARVDRILTGLALLVPGGLLWVRAWSVIRHARAGDPIAEARSTASAVYLFLVTGVAVTTFVPSAATALYRVIDGLVTGVGVVPSDPSLSQPLAVALVTALIATAHARTLRADRRLSATAAGDAASAESAEREGCRPVVEVRLALHVPAADLATTLQRLHRVVGPEARLEVIWSSVDDPPARPEASSSDVVLGPPRAPLSAL